MSTKKIKLALLIVICITAISACKKNLFTNPALIAVSVPYVQGSGVYLAGYATTADSITVPTVWYNGAMTNLSTSASDGFLVNITRQGNDVYISGSAGGNIVYWKNGIMSAPLIAPANLRYNNANNIIVQNNDVYVTATYFASPQVTVYWKNGILNYLPNGPIKSTSVAFCYNMVFKGSDIYAVGDGNFYWKDGVVVPVPGAASINDIALSGTDIYMLGAIQPNNSTNLNDAVLAYWKNDTLVNTIKTPFNHSGFTIKGNDIYLVGSTVGAKNVQVAAYLKNDVVTTLPSNNQYAVAQAIYVDDNSNVYVAGWINDNDNHAHACYWKNGVINMVAVSYSAATGITVVP